MTRAVSTSATIAGAAAIAVLAIGVRLLFAPQFDGLDDAGYLDAAQRVASGRTLDDLFPLFRTRIGMTYPLGWLMQTGWLRPDQFWLLTMAAECVTVASLVIAGTKLTGVPSAGLWAASLYAIYPLAIQQSMMFYPTAFQVASIAAACACIAAAEQSRTPQRLAFAAAGGVVLGVGYLFKEDVAIVVIMIAAATLLARWPRVTTAIAVCAGAAAVFAVECVAYWQSTGQPLYRLAATSGLGAPIGDQLQIAQIWRWDAYLRSLLLLPLQVGLMWWVGLAATAIVVFRQRRESRGLYFVAIAFVMVMIYLQFGSGSLSSYSPLPKTPRYTALATPLLMLVAGGWLARQHSVRPRRAMVITAAIASAALPCVMYLQLSSSERTRNTLAVLPTLKHLQPANLYTDYYSARVLRLLEPDAGVRVWYHAKFDTSEMVVMNDPEATADSYVLLDRQAAKIYTSSYEMRLPPSIDTPPAHWTAVWRHRAFEEDSVTRRFLETIRAAALRLPSGNPLSSRIDRSIGDMIDGDTATLYRVAARTTRY